MGTWTPQRARGQSVRDRILDGLAVISTRFGRRDRDVTTSRRSDLLDLQVFEHFGLHARHN
jgi:hypothetical protein